MSPPYTPLMRLTRVQFFLSVAVLLLCGGFFATALGAPPAADFYRPLEVVALLLTLCVVAWSTFEMREQRIASQAQLKVAEQELKIARAQEEGVGRSAQARAGLIAFALRRQIRSWLVPDVDEMTMPGDPVRRALKRRIDRGTVWRGSEIAEQRLSDLSAIGPTLSAQSAEAVAAVAGEFYSAMDMVNSYRFHEDITGDGYPELDALVVRLRALDRLLTERLIPESLRAADDDRRLDL